MLLPLRRVSRRGRPGVHTRRGILVGLALASATVVTACGSGGASQASTDSTSATAIARVSGGFNGLAGAAQQANVTIVNMTASKTFDPASVTITAGSTVGWHNASTAPQSATFDPSRATTAGDIVLPSGVTAFDSGMVAPGQTWTHTFTAPGTYKYACVPNEAAGMKGTVIVK